MAVQVCHSVLVEQQHIMQAVVAVEHITQQLPLELVALAAAGMPEQVAEKTMGQ
jgi:hypothetical protein